MRRRCDSPKLEQYPNYGGRGIRVCERWMSFENFFADVGRRPSLKHSLDRIDVNGNYEPGNVRWATARDQANNRRNAKKSFYYMEDVVAAAVWSTIKLEKADGLGF